MDFDSLGWMKDIDLAEYLGINMHTVTFDDSKWKVDELLADLEKCFTGIKCTMCNEEDASYVNLGNNKYYCENDYISIIDHPEKFEAFKKMKDELKEDIIMIERCLFMIQERNHLLFHENLVLEDEECDFTHLMEALERNLDFFKNGIHNLSDNFKLARLLDVRSSSSKIKHIAMDIFKNAAELLAGLEIEMLLKNVKEESKHALTNKNSEEVKEPTVVNEKLISEVKRDIERIKKIKMPVNMLSELLPVILKYTTVFNEYEHSNLIKILIDTLKSLGKKDTPGYRDDKEAKVLRKMTVDFLFRINDMNPYGDSKEGREMNVFNTIIEFLKDYDLRPNEKCYDEYEKSKFTQELNTLPFRAYLNSKFDDDHQMSEEVYERLKMRFKSIPLFVFYFNPNIELQEKASDGQNLKIGFFTKGTGKQIGAGMYVRYDGEAYQGYFKDGEKHIYGRVIYANGNVYEGGWNMSRLIGKGELECFNDGTREIGLRNENERRIGMFKCYGIDGRLTHRKVYEDDNEIKSEEVNEKIYYERTERNLWGVRNQTVPETRSSSCCLIF